MSFNPMSTSSETDVNEKLDQLLKDSKSEAERLSTSLKENEMNVRQMQSEVDRLGQRENSLSGQLRNMENNIDDFDKPTIRSYYQQTHEIQLRLLLLRNQLETLQSRQQEMKERNQQNNKIVQILNQRPRYDAEHTGTRVGSGLQHDAQEMISKVIQAQEDERLRVSRQLHDGPAQAMSNLVLRAEICERWMDQDINRAKSEITGLKSMVNDTLQETRRFIFELRPMILDDLGLFPTLRRYIKDYVDKNRIEVNFQPAGERRLPSHVETAIFRIIQEGLSNISTHANATTVQLLVELDSSRAQLVIEDNGVGFDVNKLAMGVQKKSLGIASMGQRIEMLNGSLNIDSTLGRGTRITAVIPMN
ncbi:MAG: sensor histidine kinase [Chloroflexota bacterium]|nr:sensor histidine kinase [Chloroflexota bacterium]